MSENQIEIIGNREVELLEKQRKVNLQKLFTPEGMDAIIGTIKKEVADFKADVSTKEGRAKIVSMAAKVAKCKSPIEKLAKEAKDESQKIIAGIQTEWKRYEGEMDTLRDQIRKPVDDIEEKEASELKARQDRLAEIKNLPNIIPFYEFSKPSDACRIALEKAKQLIEFDNWGDFEFVAKTAFEEVSDFLNKKIVDCEKSEADAAELAQLKKEKAEREQKDRDDQIAKDAAEKERKEGEQREKKILEDKRIAEEEAFLSKRKNEMFEIGLTQDIFSDFENPMRFVSKDFLLEPSQLIWSENLKEVKREIDRVLENRRLKDEKEKKRIADEAVENERKRVEAKKKVDDAVAERLAANKRHRKKINSEAIAAITKILNDPENDRPDFNSVEERLVEAIAKGEVPHIQINY
jgi:colicin import membrane protein